MFLLFCFIFLYFLFVMFFVFFIVIFFECFDGVVVRTFGVAYVACAFLNMCGLIDVWFVVKVFVDDDDECELLFGCLWWGYDLCIDVECVFLEFMFKEFIVFCSVYMMMMSVVYIVRLWVRCNVWLCCVMVVVLCDVWCEVWCSSYKMNEWATKTRRRRRD